MTERTAVWRKAVGLTLLAAVLRLFRLGFWSLWIDEGNTLWLIHHLCDSPPKRPVAAYPFFFWLERGMVEIFGTGEAALRLLPALLGIACAPLLYLLFRRPAGERAAFWGALLMALSPWHLFWSQNARYYTLLLLVAMLLYRLAWSWWEDGGRAKLTGLIALGLVGLMSQYTLALAWPALALYPFLARLAGHGKDRRFAWRRIALFLAALALPMLLALGRMQAFSGRFTELPRTYGDNPLLLLAALGYRIGLPVALAALLGMAAGLRDRDRARRRFALFLIAGSVVPALLAALATLRIIATSYYVFFSLFAFLLLAGMALERSRETRRLSLAAGIFLAAFYLQGDALYFTAQHGDRIRWKEATAFVERQREPGDHIISTGDEAVSYYLGEEPALLNETRRQTMVVWELKPEWRQPTEITWYIFNDQALEELDGDGLFRQFLRDECRIMKEYPLWNAAKNRGVRVYLFEPPAEG